MGELGPHPLLRRRETLLGAGKPLLLASALTLTGG
jgi:hypothetical protein